MQDKSSNIYGDISKMQNSFVGKIKQKIQDYMAFLILLFNIVLNIISRLYSVGFVNPFTIEYFLELSVNLTTTMLCYACFIPIGCNFEKERNLSYKPNCILWAKYSKIVRDGLNGDFRDFCYKQIEIEREEKRRKIIGDNLLIDYEEYLKKYRELSEEDLLAIFKSGELTKREYKAIRKANSRLRIRPINPIIILCGVKKHTYNDAGRDGIAYVERWMITKPFIIIVINIILNAIKPYFLGILPVEALYSMFLSVLSIILASYIGYSVGQKNIRSENDRIKNRIVFLELFMECKKIPL